MSAKMGRPTEEKRGRRYQFRLSDETYNTLVECSEKLKITKAEVVHKGIALVKAKITSKK